ncbi:MAG: PAS domain S-box protein, partial [Thermodesulfobacteriota bacterium]|nr:PAS domain S-box protein [Thermodesulfobacteriota bacterium]
MDKKPTYEKLEQRIAALKAEIATFKEAEEKFRGIFHDSLDALMIIDSNNGHILAVNETTVQMLGYEESGLVGKHFSILFPPATRQQGRELLGKLKVHGAVFTQDFLNSAGSVCTLDLTATLIPWGKGRAILANFRDIAERKRIDDAIRRAKKEWERTFDSVPDLISIIDKDYRIMRLNKTMAERIGITPQEAIGRTCYSLLHGTSEPPEFCPHTKLLTDGREHKVEIHEERLGGDFLVSASPLNDAEGKTIGCVHVVRDITDRVLIEKRLRNSKEKYQDLYRLMRLIADNVPDLIWAKELDGRFLFVNQAMCDRLLMCGSPDKAVGKTDIFFAEQEKIAGYKHSFGEICVDSDALTMKRKRPGRFVED